METKELQEALSGLKTELEKKQDEKIKAIQDKAGEDVKKLTEDIITLKEQKAASEKVLQDHLDQLDARQKDVKADTKPQSTEAQICAKLKEKKVELDHMKGNISGSVSFEIKAAAQMAIANYTGGTIGLTSWDSESTSPPLRKPFIRDIVTNRPVTGMYVAWAEIANRDGAVAATAESAAKPLIDFDWVETSMKVEKIAGRIKISKEALADIPNASAEINQELTDQIKLELDTEIIGGSGSTPILKGILTYTNTISVTGTAFAVLVPLPNNFDVLRAAAWSIENTGKGRFIPNYAILNPQDAAFMDVDKVSKTTGGYIMPPFSSVGGQQIAGLRILTSTAITAGTFLVGDFSKDILGIREEVNVQMGYDGTDFSQNLITVIGEVRAVNYIKTNNIGAFIKGTFATVKTAMTLP